MAISIGSNPSCSSGCEFDVSETSTLIGRKILHMGGIPVLEECRRPNWYGEIRGAFIYGFASLTDGQEWRSSCRKYIFLAAACITNLSEKYNIELP